MSGQEIIFCLWNKHPILSSREHAFKGNDIFALVRNDEWVKIRIISWWVYSSLASESVLAVYMNGARQVIINLQVIGEVH